MYVSMYVSMHLFCLAAHDDVVQLRGERLKTVGVDMRGAGAMKIGD
jgi:hypothetical protein